MQHVQKRRPTEGQKGSPSFCPPNDTSQGDFRPQKFGRGSRKLQPRPIFSLASAEIAHAIKHPLVALRRRLEGSHDQLLNGAQLREIIDTCISELDRMVGVFDAILDIAYIESGCLKSRFTRVDLSSVLSKLVDVYEPVVQDARQNLAVGYDDLGEAWLKGDPNLLFLIFSNLIENAIRYCPADTTISIGLIRNSGSFAVSISDDGPGLSSEDRENVFRPFFRAESTRKTEGHGLGLPLAAAIATLHDGSIALEDNGPGLRALVSLPQSRDYECAPKLNRESAQLSPPAHAGS